MEIAKNDFFNESSNVKKALQLCTDASKYINLKPFDLESDLATLSPSNSKQFLKNLKAYKSFLSSVLDLTDPKEIVEHIESEYNVKFPDDLVDCVDKDSDVIEIYDVQSYTLLAHNQKFSDLNSYSIFDLFAHPYYVLYEREKGDGELSYDDYFMVRAQESFKKMQTLPVDLPIHQIKETYQNKNRIFKQKFKYISPARPLDHKPPHILALIHETSPRKIIQSLYSKNNENQSTQQIF